VGTTIAAVLLATIGDDRARYPRPQLLLSEAGLAPVTRSSGRMRRVRFRYAANTLMRDAFAGVGLHVDQDVALGASCL
jgi:transposase